MRYFEDYWETRLGNKYCNRRYTSINTCVCTDLFTNSMYIIDYYGQYVILTLPDHSKMRYPRRKTW